MFRGLLGRLLIQSGQIPLDRFNPDPAAVKTGLRVLRDGGAIGIYPEGSRGPGDLKRFHRGAAYLALVERCMVVETPSGRSADETLIAEARERDAILVSNDRMSEWGDAARRVERFEFTLSSGGVSLIPT